MESLTNVSAQTMHVITTHRSLLSLGEIKARKMERWPFVLPEVFVKWMCVCLYAPQFVSLTVRTHIQFSVPLGQKGG